MSDIQYVTGLIKTAETITGITGATTFRGSEAAGSWVYDSKLNSLDGYTTQLDPITDTADPLYGIYDYIVHETSIPVKTEWVVTASIQTAVDWTNVPIDTQVLVSNTSLPTGLADPNAIKMYFAQYDATSPDGKYYYVWDAGRTSWSALNTSEITEATCKAASLLSGKYFRMYSTTGIYYVWYNVDSASINPSAVGQPFYGSTAVGIEIKVVATDTAELVATKTKIVIDGQTDFRAILVPNYPTKVAIATRTAGKVYDINVGTSGMTITVVTQGGDKESYRYAIISP